MLQHDPIPCDEQTALLAPQRSRDVLASILEVAKSGITMIIVTQQLAFAHDVADRIVYIEDSHIVEVGTPSAILQRPTDPRTRRFVESTTISDKPEVVTA